MVRPSGCLRTNHGDAIVPLVRAGLGIGALPESFVREDLATGAIERILPAEECWKTARWVPAPLDPKIGSRDYFQCLSSAFCTIGGFQVPSITGALGQYARMYSEKSSLIGDGSQLASAAGPGDSLCT